MAITHQRGPIGHKRYGVANWPQLGSRLELPKHPWRRVNLCGCDTLLRKPAYQESPKYREALEIHIKELLDLGLIRKVGHNKVVEKLTPVIVAWHNG
ncbi:hypothetical protein O181_096112 [Austropuccinia psidii MF-1]|uniref:Uncharacterized protein n=1 Tax=Austropuccinia psidii MF-1 TaxID=1389203 RepID=A0A9Q3J6M9_9BASI|nr:hypothetical protein [Austropuccinia psidii MF-1]